MRILITGANGSGARYLIDYLKEHQPKVEIHGTIRRKNSRKPIDGVTLYEADLLDMSSLIRCLQCAQPCVIFHMAANPDKCFETPVACLQNNAIGTLNLFEAVRTAHINFPIIVNVSSSEIYGAVKPEEIPITEECAKRPVSPYAVSKLAQDNLGSVYFRAYEMKIITTRSFTYNNHYRRNLFTSDFASQIARIEQGKQSILKHGNLDSVRVMCDARDIAEAYWLASERCRPGEAYNIGGGEKVTVAWVLGKLLTLAKIPIKYEQNPSLMRPVDVTLQVPDCSKFKKETGWEPKFDLDRSLKDLLDYWRKEIAKE